MYDSLVSVIDELYGTSRPVSLHEPQLGLRERSYVNQALDSGFISSVGQMVDWFEKEFAKIVGAKHAISTANGTAALHVALLLAGVGKGDEVISQSLTFVATCNAITYCGAVPTFVDISPDTLGISASGLRDFLQSCCDIDADGHCRNRLTGRRVSACVPMHTFGISSDIIEIVKLCDEYNIPVVEDAAEAVGSYHADKHLGTFGLVSAFSFNGNKIVTAGGGGAVVTNDAALARRAKHLTTTARIADGFEFTHNEVGFNYRMTNLNAAVGIAQLEQLDEFVQRKRRVHDVYAAWGRSNGFQIIDEPKGTKSNYWLNVLVANSKQERDEILEFTNENGVHCRPVWTPMHQLAIHGAHEGFDLPMTEYYFDRVVNLPSSPVG
ncbi:LegC family aminotransferase [Alphaproteobacteria bacterium]|nr:LegC family aminotransferase [Alphaproteobacteria bacterium]